jgi:hypothetical protein
MIGTISLRNTNVVLQRSRVGIVARIEWPDEFDHEYVGPIPNETVDSLREVA